MYLMSSKTGTHDLLVLGKCICRWSMDIEFGNLVRASYEQHTHIKRNILFSILVLFVLIFSRIQLVIKIFMLPSMEKKVIYFFDEL